MSIARPSTPRALSASTRNPIAQPTSSTDLGSSAATIASAIRPEEVLPFLLAAAVRTAQTTALEIFAAIPIRTRRPSPSRGHHMQRDAAPFQHETIAWQAPPAGLSRLDASRTGAPAGSAGDAVIQLGPSHAPLAAKSDGWNTVVVDHAPREELVAKYKGHPGVETDQIEEVDVVWRAGALHNAFPERSLRAHDAVLGSHVIEHVPDLLGLFKSFEHLLRLDGVVSLVVPDKRRSFDFFQAADDDWRPAGERRPKGGAPFKEDTLRGCCVQRQQPR